MRCAELTARRLAFACALATSLSGCAWLNSPLKADEPAAAAPATAAAHTAPIVTLQAATPATAVESATPTPAERAAAIVKTETEVAPAAQRAFDDARKALRAGRVDEAERGFRALVKSNPELGGPHANLGLIQRQAGKLPEAVAELEQAVQLAPQQAQFRNQLGITYRLQGKFNEARAAYEKALDLEPDYASATLNLGILHDLYLWDGKRALELYERYLALTPAGDATVSKWISDLKNRKAAPNTASKKEQP